MVYATFFSAERSTNSSLLLNWLGAPSSPWREAKAGNRTPGLGFTTCTRYLPLVAVPAAGVSVTVPSAAVTPSMPVPASSVRVTLTPARPGSSAGVHTPLLSTARITRTVTDPFSVCECAAGATANELLPIPKASAARQPAVRRPGMPGRRRRGSGAAPFVCTFVVAISCSQLSEGPDALLVREYIEMRRTALAAILEGL